MNGNDSSTTIGIVITLALVAVVVLVLRLAGSTFAGAFLLVAAIVLAVFILLVILITVFSIGLGKKDHRKPASSYQAGEIPTEVRAADRVLLDVIAIMEAVHNTEVRTAASKLCDQCRMINDIATRQPDELYKGELFFTSLLPLFLSVMETYITREPAGDEDLTGRTLSAMANFAVLFDRQYRAFFTTEVYDLSGEIRALEADLKKNRLV